MLKKGNIIFVGLFLLSMLFTVFNYLPIIEEESPSQRLELCKKNEQSNEGHDENSENNPSSTEEFVFSNSPFIYTPSTQKHHFTWLVLSCRDYHYSSIKPPPEV